MPIHYLIYEMLRDMSVHPINSRSVYILTGSVGLKYSDDFGDSWARIIYPGNIHPQATCFDPEHPDDFYLAGDRIYRSNDLGENWVSISDLLTLSDFILQPLSEGLYGLTSSSPQQIVYLPSANEIFQDITGDLPEVEYRQILLQPGSLEHLFLATEEGVYHTLDYGESWSLLEGPYDHDVSAIAFSEDGTDIYIGTMAQGIWTGIDIDFNNIPEQQFSSIQPASVTLFPAYPNPFNSGTYIRFDLSYTSEIEVKIFDITGRFVQTLTRGIYTSGEYQLYWNGLNSIGGHIASGCYVIKLSNDVESNQHRVILTR